MPNATDVESRIVCPWESLQTLYGPPNIKWCEERLCSYIQEPANTWSNLSYLLVAFLIFIKFRKANQQVTRDLSTVIFIMGSLSFVYHATNNFLTQALDFLGMYLFTSYLLAFCIRQILPDIRNQFYRIYFSFLLVNLCIFCLFLFVGIPIQMTVLINAIVVIAISLIVRRNSIGLGNTSRSFLYAIVFFLLAQTLSILDITRTFCIPNHAFLQGHAIWHIFSSIGIYFLSQWMVERSDLSNERFIK